LEGARQLLGAVSGVIPAIQGLNSSGVITSKIRGVITPRILGGGGK